MQGITKKIELAQTEELDEILKTVVLRYAQLLPEYEMLCLFLPKQNPEERRRILSRIESCCFPQSHRTIR